MNTCAFSPARLELDSEDDRNHVRLGIRETLLRRWREAHVARLEEQPGHAAEVEVEPGTGVPTPLIARITERDRARAARRQGTVVPVEARHATTTEDIEPAPRAAQRNPQLDVTIQLRDVQVRRMIRRRAAGEVVRPETTPRAIDPETERITREINTDWNSDVPPRAVTTARVGATEPSRVGDVAGGHRSATSEAEVCAAGPSTHPERERLGAGD